MRLNIGSNTVRIRGFVNLDYRPDSGADIIGDAETLDAVEPGSCTEIIAHNILEHFPYDRTRHVVAAWVSRLAPGGRLTIGVPDALRCFRRWERGECTRAKYRGHQWDDLQHSIFGNMDLLRQWHGDDAQRYGHAAIFSPDHLRDVMEGSGLVDVVEVGRNHADNVTMSGVLPHA